MKEEKYRPQIDGVPNNPIKNELLQNLFLTESPENTEEETASIINELQDRFAQYHWFIGLALMGSRLRGYSTEGSDIDLKIFYNSSEISNVKLAEVIKKNTAEIKGKIKDETCRITIPYFVGINTDKIQTGIQNIDSRAGLDALLTIKDLSSPATGEEISGVRENIKDVLSQLDTEKKAEILDRVVEHAIREEKASERKLMVRLNMSEEDMVDFWKTRRRLWTEHIYNLWS